MLRLIGIGAQKAGTTWLYQQLRQHPRVRFPAGKEVHFWDREYPSASGEAYRALFSDDPGQVECDMTPAYSTLAEDVVRQCRAVAPEARVVFVLRNPIERAWSSALMALERSEMTIDEASDQWFLDHFFSRGSRLRGDYARTLDIWRRQFGHQHVLVLPYAGLQEDPVAFLRQCAEFVGLDWIPAWDPRILGKPVFSGSGAPLPPHLRERLRELYAPLIAQLEGQIPWDPRCWLD